MPSLDFKGKQFVHSHHLSVPFRELRVDRKRSLPAKGAKPSLDDNLIIHGDNLEALKALLPTHAGKVDCIFIDPPYNTGNEGWCYNDNVRSPLMKEWLKKSANPVDKEDLERHDKWLCMMWPRLQLLRELLAENGTIWVTLDDNEAHRARVLMDEIFGEDNALANAIWEKADSPRMDVEFFSARHDHLLVYAKNMSDVTFRRLQRDSEDELPDHYDKVDDDGRAYYLKPLRAMGGQGETRQARPNLFYSMKAPDGTKVWPKLKNGDDGAWRWSPRKAAEEASRIEWKKTAAGWTPYFRIYADGSDGTPPETIFYNSEVGSNRTSKAEVKEILHTSDFQTPKPVGLITRILEIATDENSLILDSFAGSGTTAHAVLAANAKDGGNRRFILVETEDYADTLTAERVRRVIQGYTFTGNQRTELMREKITWTTFKKATELLEKVESIEQLEGTGYDRVKKEIKEGILTVTGERSITEKTPGLGGSFTYCELGDPIDIGSLLSGGPGMPSYETLARYVFYTATGRSLEKVAAPKADGFIGETEVFRLHLIYQPDKEWLRGNEAALDLKKLEAIEKGNKGGKRAIVFAVAKFMSQKELSARRIEFCQLPYAVHKILGD